MFYRLLTILIVAGMLLSCYHTDKYTPYRPKKPKAEVTLFGEAAQTAEKEKVL
jgi:hypothetical protein